MCLTFVIPGENRDQANQDLALANNWNNELIESLRAGEYYYIRNAY